MHADLEKLIELAVADGTITDKERAVLIRRATELGEDLEELEMVLEAKMHLMSSGVGDVRSVKQGDVKKCPACGSLATSLSAKCSACDYEFRNAESSNAVKQFFQMLQDLDRETPGDEANPLKQIGSTYARMFSPGGMFGGGKVGAQRRELIKSFPVPNNKEDILEFLFLGVPKAKKRGNLFSVYSDQGWEIKAHNVDAPVWRTKCEQIILKARFLMREDRKSLDEIEYYAKQLGIK